MQLAHHSRLWLAATLLISLQGLEIRALPVPGDEDGDGLLDGEEQGLGTNLRDPDTDDDGLLDGTEVDVADGSGCPSPVAPDSDGDTLSDGDEVLARSTDPCSADSDEDGLPDALDANPTDPDTSPSELEAATRQVAAMIDALDLGLFTGPNDNADLGRRNSLSTRVRNAANAIASGDRAAARAILESVAEKLDGAEPPEDWIAASIERDLIALFISILVGLLRE